MEFSRWEFSRQPFQSRDRTQMSNLGLLHCRQILYHPNHLGSPTGSLVLGKASGGGTWEDQFKGASSSSLVASNIWLSNSLRLDFWEVIWTEPQNSSSWQKRRAYLVISFHPPHWSTVISWSANSPTPQGAVCIGNKIISMDSHTGINRKALEWEVGDEVIWVVPGWSW